MKKTFKIKKRVEFIFVVLNLNELSNEQAIPKAAGKDEPKLSVLTNSANIQSRFVEWNK